MRDAPHVGATDPPDVRCVVVPVDGGAPRDVAPGWDRWVTGLAWTPDSARSSSTADDTGRAPLFRVDLATGTVARLTGDDGAYSDPVVGPDGSAVYALRSAVDAPPAPVRLDPTPRASSPVALPAAGPGAAAAGHPHRGHGHRRGRHAAARLARAARRRVGRHAGAAAAVDPRRSAEQLERAGTGGGTPG